MEKLHQIQKSLNVYSRKYLFSWRYQHDITKLLHSHKKQKGSMEGSLDQVLFAVELEFSKMLVPRLPQHSWNVNIECVRKSTTVFFICDQLLGVLIHLNCISLILMFLTDDAWCKLCNIWLLLCENNSRNITIPALNWRKILLQLLLKTGW